MSKVQKWVYPEQGLLVDARFGHFLESFVISQRIRTGFPYEVIIDQHTVHFGFHFTFIVPAIMDWFKKFTAIIKGSYDQLEILVKHSSFVHVNKTGLPMKGENWWLWVVRSTKEKLKEVIRSLQDEGVVEVTLEKILKRCETYVKKSFMYLKYEGMPPDNSEVERVIRPFVV